MSTIVNFVMLGMGGLPGGAGGAGGQGGGQQSPVMMIGWVVIMLAIFYFLLIRPQQRKEKERRNLIANIKTGDRIVFGGGMLGTVTNIKDHVFTVKIADNTKVDVLRGAVARVIQKDEELGKE